MKIESINAYAETITGAHVNLTVILGDIPLSQALSSVLALFAGHRTLDELPQPDAAAAIPTADAGSRARTRSVTPATPDMKPIGMGHHEEVEQPVTPIDGSPEALAAVGERTRARVRTRVAAAPPAAEPVTTPEAPPAEPVATRRRRTADAPTDTKPTISDADMSKAASNAAAVIGVEVVQAVIADFGVKTVNDIKSEDRERFLKEVAEEVRLAEEEAGK